MVGSRQPAKLQRTTQNYLVFQHFVQPSPILQDTRTCFSFPTYSHTYLPLLFLFLLSTRSHANSFYGNFVCTLETYLRDRNMGHSVIPQCPLNQRQSWLSQIVEHIFICGKPHYVIYSERMIRVPNSSNSVEGCYILTKVNNVYPFTHLNISTTKVQMIISKHFSEMKDWRPYNDFSQHL